MKKNTLFAFILLASLPYAITMHASEPQLQPFSREAFFQKLEQQKEQRLPQTWVEKLKQWASQTILSARLMARAAYYSLYLWKNPKESLSLPVKDLPNKKYPRIFQKFDSSYNKLPNEINDEILQKIEDVINKEKTAHDELFLARTHEGLQHHNIDNIMMRIVTQQEIFKTEILPTLQQNNVIEFMQNNEDSWLILANKIAENVSYAGYIIDLDKSNWDTIYTKFICLKELKSLIEETGDIKNNQSPNKKLLDTLNKQFEQFRNMIVRTKPEGLFLHLPEDEWQPRSKLLWLPSTINDDFVSSLTTIIKIMRWGYNKSQSNNGQTYERNIKKASDNFSQNLLPTLRRDDVSAALQRYGWLMLADKVEKKWNPISEGILDAQHIIFRELRTLLKKTGHIEENRIGEPDKTLFDSLIKQSGN